VTSLNQAVVEAGGGWSVSFGGNVGTSDTLFAAITGYASTNVTISSSNPQFNGSAVTGAVKILEASYPYDSSNTVYAAVWMFPPPSGGWAASAGPIAVTVTNSLTISNVGIIAYDVAGLGATPATDQLATADGNSAAPSSGATGVTLFANEFVLGILVQDVGQNTGPGAPWSTQVATDGDTNSISAYVLPSAAGTAYTYSDTTTGSARWVAGVVTIYAGGTATVTATQPSATVPVPRRRPARAYIRFRPVTTTNAAAVTGVPGTVPVLMANPARVVVRRDGRVVRR